MINVYLSILVPTFMLMTFIFIFGYAFKRWVETKEGILRKILNPLLMVIIGIGFLVDVFLNLLLTPIFLEAPKHILETVTMRVKRYKKTETGYKLTFALWLCNLANKHDKGHC